VQFFAAFPFLGACAGFWARVPVAIALAGTLAMAALAIRAIAGMVLNCCVGCGSTLGHGADTHDKCLQKKNRTILDPGADAQCARKALAEGKEVTLWKLCTGTQRV
jgi:hypothetical protein